MAVPLTALIFDYGAASGTTRAVALTFAALMPGLIAFTVHYLSLRGFYALQDTRTPFLVQVWIAAAMTVNAVLVAQFAPAAHITIWLAAGFSAAYVLGSAVSLSVLRRRIGGPAPAALLLYIGHVLIPALLAGAAAYGVVKALDGLNVPGWIGNLVVLGSAGTIGLTLYVVASYLLRVGAVREAIGMIAARLGRRRSGSRPTMGGQRDDS
jgi:putative peptidoglycan lipid II flippase